MAVAVAVVVVVFITQTFRLLRVLLSTSQLVRVAQVAGVQVTGLNRVLIPMGIQTTSGVRLEVQLVVHGPHAPVERRVPHRVNQVPLI